MTNREKFAEKILDVACSGSRLAVNKATLEPVACNGLKCKDCLFNHGIDNCEGEAGKWANSEFDVEILDDLAIDPFSDVRGLTALFYRNLWATANLRETLKKYEDLEEQGRLIKLPCKVGDTVWDNDYGRPCAYTITAFSFGECEEYICEPVTTKEVVFYYANSSGSITGSFAESEIGKTVFLTKSEAEAKLKELRGEKDD